MTPTLKSDIERLLQLSKARTPGHWRIGVNFGGINKEGQMEYYKDKSIWATNIPVTDDMLFKPETDRKRVLSIGGDYGSTFHSDPYSGEIEICDLEFIAEAPVMMDTIRTLLEMNEKMAEALAYYSDVKFWPLVMFDPHDPYGYAHIPSPDKAIEALSTNREVMGMQDYGAGKFIPLDKNSVNILPIAESGPAIKLTHIINKNGCSVCGTDIFHCAAFNALKTKPTAEDREKAISIMLKAAAHTMNWRAGMSCAYDALLAMRG